MALTFAGRWGPESITDLVGHPLPRASCEIYLEGTSTLATLYTDKTKATPAANPVEASSRGNLQFFADPDDYDIVVTPVRGNPQPLLTVTVEADPEDVEAGDTGLLNPMTTRDDVILAGVAGAPARLAKGADGQVLMVDPATHHVAWISIPESDITGLVADLASKMTNPMTTAEDLVVGGASGVPARKAKGAEGTVLQIVGGALSWQPISSAPAGPAGGMLAGSYPSPSIANGSIKAVHIAPDAHIPESVLDLDSYLSLTRAEVQIVASNVDMGGGLRVTGINPGIPAAAATAGVTVDYFSSQGYLQVVDGAGALLPLNVRSNLVLIGQRPDSTVNYGLLSLGSGLFSGGGAPHFAGSANGTHLAINAIAAFSGNLIDAQSSGVSQFKVDSTGQLIVRSKGFIGDNLRIGSVGVDNMLLLSRAATGSPVQIAPSSVSIDANVPLQLSGLGTGKVQVLAAGAGAVGAEIKLAASPTAHALDISSSSGTADLLYVDSAGNLVAYGGLWAGQALANQAKLLGAAAASPVSLTAIGSDTNIGVKLVPKGSGTVLIGGTIPAQADGDSWLTVDASGNVHKAADAWHDMQPLHTLGTISSALGATTLILGPGSNGVTLGAAAGAGLAFYIDPAWYALNGRTMKVRVVVTFNTDTVAPAVNFTFALSPVATWTRASNTRTAVATLGANICSAAINTPAANTPTHVEGASATLSAADYYALTLTTSGTTAVNSVEDFNVRLQYQLI